MSDEGKPDEILAKLNRRGLSRRDFIKAAAALGISASGISAFLASCAPEVAETPTRVPPTTAPSPTQVPPTPAPSPTSAPAGPTGQITVVQSGDASTMDPFKEYGTPGLRIQRHVYDTLASRWDLEPVLSTSWELEDDRTWVFHLREGVKFHNGEEFDASVVKFNVERYVDPEIAATFAADYRLITEVQVVDDSTCKVLTEEPYGELLKVLSDSLYIVPPEASQSLGIDKAAIGTGPYKCAEWTPGDRAVLEANEAYWGAAPNIKTIVWKPVEEGSVRVVELKTGAADLIDGVPPESVPELEETPGVSVVRQESTTSRVVVLNCGKEPLNDKRVRQALQYAVNKDEIIEYILLGSGYPMPGVLPPTYSGHDPSLTAYPYDPQKAKSLLADAGYGDGFRLTFQGTTGKYVKDKEVMESITGYLGDVGIEVELNTMEWATFLQHFQEGNGYLIGNVWDRAQRLLAACFSSREPTYAWHGYSNSEVDDLIEEAMVTMEPSEMDNIHREINKTIWDDAPWLFLYLTEDIYGVQDRLKGFDPNPDAMFFLTSCWLET